jgi:cysteine desulfurase
LSKAQRFISFGYRAIHRKTSVICKQFIFGFIVASAHKFHGPKELVLLFYSKNSGLQPYLVENGKGLRAGTEALHQIAGIAKPFSLAI